MSKIRRVESRGAAPFVGYTDKLELFAKTHRVAELREFQPDMP